MPPGFAELGTWTSTPWENRELAQVPGRSVTRCEWGWDKRLRPETAFWTRGTKPTRSYLPSPFCNSPTITPAMWKKPRATSWSSKSRLACYIPALSTVDKALSLHHPCTKHVEGWWQLWSTLVIEWLMKTETNALVTLNVKGKTEWPLGKLFFLHAIFPSHLKRDDHQFWKPWSN